MWYKMRLIILCLILTTGVTEAKKIKWKYLKKVRCDKVEIVVKGKKRNYCKFDSKSPITVKIKGPTRLKIMTRIELPEGFTGKKEYKLEVVEDSKKSKEFSIATEQSKPAVFADKKVSIGKSRNIYINVPSGTHSYSLRLMEPKDGVGYARFYRKLRKLKYTFFAPQTYSSVETIIVKEKERAYYRGTKEKGVVVEVFGPTKLKVVTRLEFTPDMQGEQTYGVQVIDEKKEYIEKKEHTFKTSKSEVSGYATNRSYVPGVSRKFILEVPKGKWKYEFKPMGASSVLFRFFIPQKDIGKGK